MTKRRRSTRMVTALTLIGLALLLIWPSFVQAVPLTAGQQVQASWNLANDLASYDYQTDLIQTIHPTNKLVNLGRQSRKEHIQISGYTDRLNEQFYMKLEGKQALEMKISDGQSYGRAVGSEQWERLDGKEQAASEMFAPNGDPLGFLAAADNVERAGMPRQIVADQSAEAQSGLDEFLNPAYGQPHTVYSFEVNGPRYAEHMRQQLTQQLRERGELPAGMTVGLADVYVEMTGHGQLWISEDGLPLRIETYLEFPPTMEEAREWVSAEFTTNFSNWQKADTLGKQVMFAAQRIQKQPTDVFQVSYDLLPKPSTDFMLLLGLSLLLGAVVVLMVTYSHSRKVYTAFSLSVIFTMVFSPLMRGHQVNAYYDQQMTRQMEHVETQALQAEQEALRADLMGEDFNPRLDPLAESATDETSAIAEERAQSAVTALETTSSDDETTYCDADREDSDTDEDNDGLSDSAECDELGTWATIADTDGDLISDLVEVEGVTAQSDSSNTRWYLNPLHPDSNGDGLTDLLECPALETADSNGNVINNNTPTSTQCPDTDLDGVPDLFDFDNDGDGVPDSVDSSPFYNGDITTQAREEFNYNLTGYSTDTSIVVDFELRPPDESHLYQTYNVLDWPTGDTEGQITRVYDTTWVDQPDETGEAYALNSKTDNGDMMLIPMLEISLPDSASSGLPVLDSYTGTIANTDNISLTEWLDTDTLDQYSISVSQDEDTGELYVYLPLYQLEDTTGDTPVAWAGQMYYRPENASWDTNHTVKMVWLVNALVDTCDTSNMTDDNTYDEWCSADNTDNWTTSTSIIHTYYEEFHLTGFSVREDNGFKSAIITQNDALGKDYADDLWALSYGLSTTFNEGMLLSDGSRFDIDEIDDRFGQNNASGDEDWGLDPTNFSVDSYSYSDQATGLDNLVNSDLPNALTTNYTTTNNTQPNTDDIVTVLIAREEQYRSTNLDNDEVSVDTSGSVASIEVNLSGVDRETYATLSWNPYQYDGSSWAGYDYEEYISNDLGDKLANALDDSELQNWLDDLGSEYDDLPTTENGVIGIGKSYYWVMALGDTELVEATGQVVNDETLSDTDLNLAAYEGVLTVATVELETSRIFFDLVGETSIDEIFELLQAWSDLGQLLEDDLTDYWELNLVGSALGDLVKWSAKKYYKKKYKLSKILSDAGTYTIADKKFKPSKVTGKASFVAATAYTVSFFTKGTTSTVFAITGASLDILSRTTGFLKYAQYLSTVKTADSASKLAKGIKSTIQVSSWAGLGIDVGIAGLIFATTIVGNNIDASSLAFTSALATFIAQVIVAIILFAIALIPGGAVFVAVLDLIDAVIILICEAVREAGVETSEAVDTWVCNGITGALTEAITYLVHDQTPLVNLNKKSRVALGLNDVSLVDDGDGFMVGNGIQISGVVTTSLYFDEPDLLGWAEWEMFSDDNLKKSEFGYLIQDSKTTVSKSIPDDGWEDTSNKDASLYNIPDDKQAQGTYDFTTSDILFTQSGMNQKFDELYFSESLKVKAQECWNVVGHVTCKLRDYKSTSHNDISQNFVFDVLPATFDEFVELEGNRFDEPGQSGHRLAWDEGFPILNDADGDGLPREYDPDDGDPDYDNDGLNDYWEYKNGYDPSDEDADGDCLTDYWEAFYNSDPNLGDTDGDGLADGLEVYHPAYINPYSNSGNVVDCDSDGDGNDDNHTWIGGWEIVYDYDESAASQKTTRVNADPLYSDADGDNIFDRYEYVYGYNPNVAETINVLNLQAELETNVVAANSTLPFTATIKNELDNRYASGLLEGEHPIDTVQVSTVLDTLAPRESVTLNDSLSIDLSSTQATSVSLRAGAIIEEIADDKLLWLKLNEAAGSTTFADSSLNGNDADCWIGCPTANGSYLDFSTGYSGLRVDGNMDDDSFTVSFWVYPLSSGRAQLFLSVGQGSASRIEINQLANNVRAEIGNDTLSAGTGLTTNNWSHIALTIDSEAAALYVNSTLVDTLDAPNIADDDSRDFYFGDGSGVENIDGYLDDIRIYNDALSVAQINSLVNAPVLDINMNNIGSYEDSSNRSNIITSDRAPSSGSNGAVFTRSDFNYLEVSGNSLDLEDNEFTFSMWLYPEWLGGISWADGREVMGIFGDGDISVDPYTYNYPSLFMYENGQLELIFDTENNETCTYQTSSGTITYDSWQYLTMTYDGDEDTLTTYINGSAVGTSTSTGCANSTPVVSTDSDFYIGKSNLLVYFQGQLDDFKLYNYALSDDEVETLYGTSYLALDMAFDEPPGTDVFSDDSGNELEATCDSINDTCPDSGLAGRDNQALRFDGDDDYLQISSPGFDESLADGFTAGLWFKLEDIGTDPRIIHQTNGTATGRVWFAISNNRLYTFIQGSRFELSDVIIEEDKWYYAVLTYEGSLVGLGLYDGEQVYYDTSLGAAQITDGDLYLGADKSLTSDLYLHGWLDDLTIQKGGSLSYLSAADPVLWLDAQLGISNPTNGATVAQWQDLSGNDYHATQSTNSHKPTYRTNPTLGSPAVSFDGTNDQLELSRMIEDDFTMFVVFATGQSYNDGDDDHWYHGAGLVDGEVANVRNDFGMSLVNGRLATGVGNSDVTILSSNSFNDDDAHIAIFERSKSTGEIKQYVDGSLTGSDTGSTRSLNEPSRLVIGSLQTDINYFEGEIAEVLIYDQVLSDDERQQVQTYLDRKYGFSNGDASRFPSVIEELAFEAPVLNLHLDESVETTTFTDETPYQNDFTCTDPDCPEAGLAGRVREAAVFQGNESLQLDNVSGDEWYLDTFTLSAWVQPEQASNSGQWILNKVNSDDDTSLNFRLLLQSHTLAPRFSIRRNCTGSSSNWRILDPDNSSFELTANQWSHIAATYDGSAMILYVNGFEAGRYDSGSNNVCVSSTKEDITIGQDFIGNLDEVAIYGRAMTTDEVSDLYNYQSAWYDIAEEFTVQVDADGPLFNDFMVNDSYLSVDTDVQLSVSVSDSPAGLASLTYSVNGGSAQSIDLTSGTNGGHAFTFTPTGGEGTYTIDFTATDAVGNSSTHSGQVTVDNTAGTAILTGVSSAGRTAHSSVDTVQAPTNGIVTLSGTVSDSGVGVDESKVWVSVHDGLGNSVSGRELATVYVLTSTWTVDYPFGNAPYGPYTVKLMVEDRLGNNSGEVEAGTITLDGYGPVGDILLDTNVLTDTTVTGVVSDPLYPTQNRVLHLHFEEDNGATEFFDSSGNAFHASCASTGSATCPTAGQSGLFGNALEFTGSENLTIDNDLISDTLDVNNADQTMMAWIYHHGSRDYNNIVAFKVGTGRTAGWALRINNNNQAELFVSDGSSRWDTLSEVLSANTWHHVAGVIDRTDGEVRLYVNGILVDTVTDFSGDLSHTTDLLIGSWATGNNWDYFDGLIDEVAIYNTALSDETIYKIANPTGATVSEAKARYRHASGAVWPGLRPDDVALYLPLDTDNLTDFSLNAHEVSCDDHCPTSSQEGKHGPSAEFDGSDDYLDVPFVFDPSTQSEFTLSAWFKLDTLTGNNYILQQENGSGRGRSWLFVSEDNFVSTWLGGSGLNGSSSISLGEWHHIAVTYDGTTVSLYLDGNQENSEARTLEFSDGDLLVGEHKNDWGNFDGNIDELVIFERALSETEIGLLATDPWQSVTLDSNSALSTWSTTVPSDLADGPYQLDLLASDTLGNSSVMLGLWNGEIDTQAPKLTFTVNDLGGGNVDVTCGATDFNLDDTSWNCPVGSTPTITYTDQHADYDWFTTLFTDTSQLVELAVSGTITDVIDFTVCDSYGHCSTQSQATARSARNIPTSVSRILTPTTEVLSSLQAIDVGGIVSSNDGLQSLSVTANGQVIHSQTWADNPASATWTTNWTPANEGKYDLIATLTTAISETVSGTATIYVDLTDPTVSIATSQFNQANVRGNRLQVTGTVNDATAIARLEAKVDDGPWRLVPLTDGTSYTASVAVNGRLTADSYTITVRATDHAGRSASSSQTIPFDLSPPTGLALTLQAEGQPYHPGDTIVASSPAVVVNWNTSDAVSHQVEWLNNGTTVASETLAGTASQHSYQAASGQTLTVRVTASDASGNSASRELGPIFVDDAQTPVLAELTGFGNLSALTSQPYEGWLTNGCTLLGIDHRRAQATSDAGTFDRPQQLHSSWNGDALRLAWQGADWRTQGDLFIYLDTVESGGATMAYNPFDSSAEVTVVLPTDMSNNSFTADYLVWVRETPITETVTVEDDDGSTETITQTVQQGAVLLQWDGDSAQWQEVDGEFGYRLDTQRPSPLTDIYLPFSLLGISDPATQSLGLVAFASEEEQLKLWASLPAANNLNSKAVVNNAVTSEVENFTLINHYQWSNLGDGICPSQDGGDELALYNGAELSVSMSSDPGGVSYSLFDDQVIFAHRKLFAEAADWTALDNQACANWRADPDRPANAPPPPACRRLKSDTSTNMHPRRDLRRLMNTDTDYVSDGDEINLTVTIANNGTETAHRVRGELLRPAQMTFTDGPFAPAPPGRFELEVGDLPAGESRTFNITARVESNPDTNKGWTHVKLLVFDETGSPRRPNHQLHLDHPLDTKGPSYVELTNPTNLVKPGQTTFRGVVIDESPISTVLVEVGGSQTTCSDSTPADSSWTCEVSIPGGTDGQSLTTRLKAIDVHGQESDWFDGPTLTLDSSAPVVTASGVLTGTLGDGLIGPNETALVGTLSDNRFAHKVVVCEGDSCADANVLLDSTTVPTTSYVYRDEPEESLVVGSNHSCPDKLARTFDVGDSFTVADLDVGLLMGHDNRNDAVAWLTSPNGTRKELVSRGANVSNLNVLLDDAASLSLFVDGDQSDHMISPPFFSNVRRPHRHQLAEFRGENAQGTWLLELCDHYDDEDDGLYYRSELRFTAQAVYTGTVGTWQHTLNLPANQEAITKTYTVYGVDQAGNQSEPVTFSVNIDTKSPELSVDTTTPLFSPTRGMSTFTGPITLAGTVNDANLNVMRLIARTPNGQFIRDRIPVTGQTWQYTDATTFNREGLYCIWVEAEDEADNQQTSAAVALQVTFGQVTSSDSEQIDPSLMSQELTIGQSENNGQYRLFLPLIGVSYNNDSQSVYRYFVDPAVCR